MLELEAHDLRARVAFALGFGLNFDRICAHSSRRVSSVSLRGRVVDNAGLSSESGRHQGIYGIGWQHARQLCEEAVGDKLRPSTGPSFVAIAVEIV